MTFSAQLETIAASIGFLAALFFGLGALVIRSKEIIDISSTYWDYNENLQKSLVAQRADYIIGALLLLASFLIQVYLGFTSTSVTEPIRVLGTSYSFVLILVSVVILMAFVVRKIVRKLTNTKVSFLRKKQLKEDEAEESEGTNNEIK